MSFGNQTFVRLIVGRASRLPSRDLRPPAGRPRYIQKSKTRSFWYYITYYLQPNNRSEAGAKKRRPKNYQLLTKPRKSMGHVPKINRPTKPSQNHPKHALS